MSLIEDESEVSFELQHPCLENENKDESCSLYLFHIDENVDLTNDNDYIYIFEENNSHNIKHLNINETYNYLAHESFLLPCLSSINNYVMHELSFEGVNSYCDFYLIFASFSSESLSFSLLDSQFRKDVLLLQNQSFSDTFSLCAPMSEDHNWYEEYLRVKYQNLAQIIKPEDQNWFEDRICVKCFCA